MADTDSTEKCFFCPNLSLYTCPKCNVHYCSSTCYKCSKHLKCSETFYKDLVKEELKGATASEESQQKMREILQKMQCSEKEQTGVDEDDGIDSDDDDDLEDRLKGINLDDSDSVWANLSQTEQQEFLDLMKEGKTADIIPPWTAWWKIRSPVSEVCEGTSLEVPPFIETCPTVLDCPTLSQVMSAEPSPSIPFNIMNVLTAYVWTVRLFNGDHQENCVDATEAILSLSPALSSAANYSSAEIAVTTPKVESQNYSWLCESEEFGGTVREDMKNILKGPNASFRTFYVAAALSDIHTLFSTCKSALTSKRKERCGTFASSISYFSQEIPKKFTTTDLVKNCIKKLEFYLSYIKEYPFKLPLEEAVS